jgi:glycosyltransferase involved in cell wall biosynthesis
MAQSKVFLFPSHLESWGHAAVEAMAIGLPVVGYDLPSSREVFGDAMLTVPTGDTSAFARTVLSLLGSNSLREEYSARGLRVAEKCDWDKIASQFFANVFD